MDGISVAASIIGIATAGIQISIKLITLATQISTASDRISSIGNDISLTSGVLQQLGELMNQKTSDGCINIFSQGGLETTRTAAAMCQRVFEDIEKVTKVASEQVRGSGRLKGCKIKLSNTEKARFPFLQPTLEILRVDLREAKGTLMLMLQVATLAFSRRMAELHMSATLDINEQKDLFHGILAIQKEQKELASKRIDEKPKEFVPPKAGTGSSPSQISISTSGLTANYCTSGPFHNSEEEIVGNSYGSLGYLPSAPDKVSNENTVNGKKRDLHIFILKPIVQDLVDVIQLSWAVHRVKMHWREIYKELDRNEREEMPSVLEILETLQPHEHRAVDRTVYNAGPDSSLLSLKRTKNNIHHREMTFQGVPGLQFIIQQQVSQSTMEPISESACQPHQYLGFREPLFRSERPSQPPITPDASDLKMTDPYAEVFKSLRITKDEPCRRILPALVKKHNFNEDWRKYSLYIVTEGHEHLVGWEEKPLLLFKQLDQKGQRPMFMLRLSESVKEPLNAGDPLEDNEDLSSNPTIPLLECADSSWLSRSLSEDSIESASSMETRAVDKTDGEPEDEEKIVNELLGKYTTLFEAH